jgi:uncharacterized protein (TIGR02444 family)
VSLWGWALAAYARPGVAPACLVLQDAHGQNVPLLLAAGWACLEGRALDAKAAAGLARNWETAVVSPLRAVRRALKLPAPAIDDPSREALRSRVKAVELDAERLLLETLERLSVFGAGDRLDTETAIGAAASHYADLAGVAGPPRAAIKNLSDLICYGDHP